MTLASYDRNFLEANISGYGFGVDTFSLVQSDSLTLVITNPKSGVNAASTSGFRRINNTRMIDLVYRFKLPDGSVDDAQVNCYDYL